MRFGIAFDQVLEHLNWPEKHATCTYPAIERSFDDLALAIACTENQPEAWDEINALGHWMRQHVAALPVADDVSGLVRRFIFVLRMNSVSGADDRPTLRAYCGDRPLGSWLSAEVRRFALQASADVDKDARTFHAGSPNIVWINRRSDPAADTPAAVGDYQHQPPATGSDGQHARIS